jgi:hypothetical protein
MMYSNVTTPAIQDLQSHAVAQAAKFEIRFASLENSISQCQKTIENGNQFSAILHTQQLCGIILPNPPSYEHEALVIRQQETLLAPREHWEANISEIQAPGWLTSSPRPILWIGGRRNRRNVTWVSSFTLDLVDAMEIEPSVHAICTLCNNRQENGPLAIFKSAIAQLLKVYPGIVLEPSNLDKLSLQRFRSIGESPEVAFRVLADILKMVDTKCQQDGIELFWVIDRVDVLLTKENLQGKQRFVKALLQLAVEYKNLRILLTSQFSVGEMEIAVGGVCSLMEIWVDTTKPLAMHSRQ